MVAGVRKGIAEFYVPRNARHVECQQPCKRKIKPKMFSIKSLQRLLKRTMFSMSKKINYS